MLFRNPYAILVNIAALFNPPREPERYGAMLADIAEVEQSEFSQTDTGDVPAG
jgi:hypothetical protein